MSICLSPNHTTTFFESLVVFVFHISGLTKLISFHFVLSHVCFLATALAIMVTNSFHILVVYMCQEILFCMKHSSPLLFVMVRSFARHHLKAMSFHNPSSSPRTLSFNILLLILLIFVHQLVLLLLFLSHPLIHLLLILVHLILIKFLHLLNYILLMLLILLLILLFILICSCSCG